jgi:hypothetical protein
MHLENRIIESFTGKTSLSDTSDATWSALVNQYPAFNLGYYFRAKRQGQPTDNEVPEIRWQAASHFNDVRWLDYMLKQQADKDGQHLKQDVLPARTGKAAGSELVQKEQAPDAAVLGGTAEILEADTRPAAADPAVVLSDKAGPAIRENEEIRLDAAEEHSDSAPAIEEAAEQEDNTRLSAVLSAQLADFKKPVEEDARLEVDREPLYKVDYFASQGISVLKNQDGFDRKVRRFTDWLKEMKQQGTGTAGPQLNTTPQEEAQAAEKAEKSLKNEPVWTESMAEVLLSQGKTTQAREVYLKLSLLYPEKSTYFASKIDLLQ